MGILDKFLDKWANVKLKWSITITDTEFEKLLQTGKHEFLDGTFYLQKKQDPVTNKFWGVVGFTFNQLPPKEMMFDWLNSIYDGDKEANERAVTALQQNQRAKLKRT